MPPRAIWKGHVKVSLVSFAVRVYNATSSARRVSLNQLHKDCNMRLKQKMACPEHGEVGRDDIVKGYEFEKGKYVVVEPDDLEQIRLETTKTIDIRQFVDREEVDSMFLNSPYYIAPDGPVAMDAYRVIREALRKTGKVGIGQYVVAGREHVVVLDTRSNGLLMTTLRSAEEVREATPYFEEITEAELDDGHLKLAEQLIEASSAPLDTSKFRDRYQDALLEMIKAKVEGKEPTVVQADEVAKTMSFMDALQASIQEAAKTTKKPPAKSVKKTSRKTRKKA